MDNSTISDLNTMSGGGESLLAGRYCVVRKLGQGGMGDVWLAEDTTLDNHPVAVKMLPAILVANRRALRQLKAEALVALRLSHPNIATLRSFEENGGNPFLVIDFIDGQSLDDVLADRESLTEEETVRLLGPVAAALDYAHAQGVVHRDVKPGNVMVRADGTPFVLDFGIAREIQETLTRATGRYTSGTLMYMSPEQLHGAAPKPAQDVYSLAAMAYECLAGHPPFFRGQVEFQILNDAPPPLPADTPLARAILKGLSKDPGDRPACCLAVLGEGASAPAPGRQASDSPPTAPSSQGASSLSDAEVYLLDAEARHLFEETVSKFRQMNHPELDNDLLRARRTYEAATNALAHGNTAAAGSLFLEFLAYPAQRAQSAMDLAVAAFRADRLEEAFRLSENADPASPEILFLRGVCRERGVGTARDEARAFADYAAAAQAGHAEARRRLDERREQEELEARRLAESPAGKIVADMVQIPGKDYKIGRTQVTQAQWEALMGNNPSYFKGADRPVECVSWDDCQAFIQKLNAESAVKQAKLHFRLPTEEEWEHACRAGGTGDWGRRKNGEEGPLDAMGWYRGNSERKPHPVAQKEPNAWGLYDMHGNVGEWTSTAKDSCRVYRGGCWGADARFCRSAGRGRFRPSYRNGSLGFRLCCSAGPRE